MRRARFSTASNRSAGHNAPCGVAADSQRLQELNEIKFLIVRQREPELLDVVIDDRGQIRRASVVEVRRMLPERTQQCGSILPGGASACIRRIGSASDGSCRSGRCFRGPFGTSVNVDSE